MCVCVRACAHVCVSHPRLCETVVPLEDPIITETTSTLQEWGVLWKQLYVVSSTHPLTPPCEALCLATACSGLMDAYYLAGSEIS